MELVISNVVANQRRRIATTIKTGSKRGAHSRRREAIATVRVLSISRPILGKRTVRSETQRRRRRGKSGMGGEGGGREGHQKVSRECGGWA
jgi:hypothetical protein